VYGDPVDSDFELESDGSLLTCPVDGVPLSPEPSETSAEVFWRCGQCHEVRLVQDPDGVRSA